LEHPYFSNLHYPDDEPETVPVSPFDFDFENYSLSRNEYRQLIYEEILLYHSDEAAVNYVNAKRNFPEGMIHLRFPHLADVATQ
jgi:hypothetical protein